MRRSPWPIAACALAALLVGRSAAQGPPPARLVYGGDSSAGPYESLDAAGRPRGFNVDLVRALGQGRGLAVEFRFGPWPQILRALEAGEVDLIGIAYTDERAQRYDMLAEIWTLRQAIFFPEGRRDPPRGLAQLGAETIAVPEGLYMHDFLAALPELQRPLLRPAASSVQQIELLRRAEVTAVAGNALLLNGAAARAGLRGLHEVPVKALSYQLAARKGRGAEFAWIPAALDSLRASGEHTRFVERHLSDPIALRRSWREFALPALIALGALGFGVAAAVAWNRSLRGQVQARTRELKQSLSLVQSALESTADGLLVVDRQGRVTAFNHRFATMWRLPAELLERRDHEALLAHVLDQLADPQRFLSRVRELYSDSALESNDILEFKDGRVFERYSLPQRLDGETVGRVWSFRDISARRRAEERGAQLTESMRRSERMAAMGTLVAGVAHEVRNPLFNLTSTLDVFETRLQPRPEDRRYLDTLRRELNRLAALMRELLDYGRPPELALRSGEVEDALREAVSFSEGLATLAQVRLRVEQDGRLPPVLMDRPRLVQALQNLIQNAVQHSPRGGEVVARAEREPNGGAVTCTVKDSGTGFQPEDLPHVFEPFFTRRRGGTGLGLSLVQRIVEQHGGSVVAANHPEGGALMTVRLPEERRA
jgi:PAS domain S-box-containing protein